MLQNEQSQSSKFYNTKLKITNLCSDTKHVRAHIQKMQENKVTRAPRVEKNGAIFFSPGRARNF